MGKRLLFLAAVLAVFLSACGKENRPDEKTVAGTYQSTNWILDGWDSRCERTILILRADGRFLLRRCTMGPEKTRRESAWEGQYVLEGSRLTLRGDCKSYVLLYLDGALYWNTLEKVPRRDPES